MPNNTSACDNRNAVNLRGHHLLCVLTHMGAGYTPQFIENLDRQIARLNQGAEARIVQGPDDLCAALLKAGRESCTRHPHAKVCEQSRLINERDRMALADISRLLQMPVPDPGETLPMGKSEIVWLRKAFAENKIRRACADCPWHDACTEVAARNFKDVKLRPEAVPVVWQKIRPKAE